MLKKFALACGVVAALAGPAHADQKDALTTMAQYVGSDCTLSPTQFSTWFSSGSITKNGAVNAADSVNFMPTSDCAFYKWASQMILWITSPDGGTIVLDSATFYDVNFNSSGNAVYIPNTLSVPNNRFALRGTKMEKVQPGGQAGGGDTLLSLNGSLVYFAEHANDVYAWFNTAVINQAPGFSASTPFPTTQPELANILNYATSNGANISDGNALTMELKTAWVDASTVANISQYITITASVPNYVGAIGAQTWTISTTQPTITKTLALVGVHVVGPVAQNPEMVWATFEHLTNAPDNSFYLASQTGAVVEIPYNSTGTWTFMTNGGSQTGALEAQMTVASNGDINAKPGKSIVANNVFRATPWGGLPTSASAVNNSRLVSLNSDIIQMLSMVGDVRGNYMQIGAVWTSNGSIPTSGTDTGSQAGSLALANSTMETYHQQDANTGCFECHYSSTGSSTGTSHLFSTTNVPLPTR
jgi:hypothetical protein